MNEAWLSDRDRYSHTGLRSADRLQTPMVRDGANLRPASWEEALAKTAELLKAEAGDGLGVLVHPATTNEEGALLRKIADALGTGNVDHRLKGVDFADNAAALPFEMSLAEVEKARSVLLVGCNPRLEAPLLGHRLRKAWKGGAQINAVNPVEFDFNFDVRNLQLVAPDAMVDALLRVARAVGEGSAETPPAGTADALAKAQAGEGDNAIAQSLRDASSSVIILGEIALSHPQASWLRAIARYIARSTGARVNELPQGANAIGLARAGVLPKDSHAQDMLVHPRQAYVLYGIEPEYDFADNAQALRSLSQARSVIAFTAHATPALQATAQVLLPIGLLPEIEGTLTNVDGLEQTALAGAKLPGEARPGWRVLRILGELLGVAGFDFTDFAGARAAATMSPVVPPQQRLSPRAAPMPGGSLQRIASTGVYRTDAVVRRAAPLNAHPLNRGASITLHPEDALALGLAAGAIAKIDDGRGIAALPVQVSTAVAKGGAWIESGHAATAPIALHGALTVKKA